MFERSAVTLPASQLPRWLAPALIALIVALFALRDLPWHLDDYDQAKQAFVSFEMVHQGDWWFQHTPTGRIATKPPLAGWISAALALATGQKLWDLAWRLPPLLSALLILRILWIAGYRRAELLGAVLAAAAFGLNLFAPRLASLVRTDMMLTLWIFLAGYMVYERLRTGTPWDSRSRWAMFAVLLASMLTKGPIAYAFLLPGVLAFRWIQRRTPDARLVWSGSWSWFAPLLFFGIWVAVGIWLSREFYQEVVLDEFLGRFTVGEGAKHHNFGVHFYFLQLLHRFFPWSLALIGCAFIPDVRAKLRRDPALLWLVCWAVGGIVFMSLVPSKRADRIFPAVPPMCLLLAGMAGLISRAQIGTWSLRRVTLVLLGLGVLSPGGYACYCVVKGYRTNQGTLVEFGRRVRESVPQERLAAISGKDEGMLLYTRRPSFTKPDDAVAKWVAGEIDGVVIPLSVLHERKEDFPASRVAFESAKAPEKSSRYALLVRTE